MLDEYVRKQVTGWDVREDHGGEDSIRPSRNHESRVKIPNSKHQIPNKLQMNK
jgi:hypothetical protein